MKNFIITFFLSLILTNIAHAKLSKDFWNEVFYGCYYSGEQTKKLKAFCTCYTNKFDANFSDEEILEFIQSAGDLTKNPTVKKWSRQCYDKHK